MSQRLRLTLLCGALAAALSLALPAAANDDARGATGHALDRAAPRAGTPGERAKDEPAAPQEQQMPMPAGCPFRDGKLELIA